MNQQDSSQRSRGPSNGALASQNPRPGLENRTGGSRTAGPSMTRAEKFEDEKNRIIESCFGKKEADGSTSESYITHIRILEDAAYPSTPPPAESPPENKKPRVIIVAVRRSGRVKMHKARENANGSFSIGKSWVLDDLTLIQSYTKIVPTSPEQRQDKERAGAVGFVVTVQKPYYWQASTPKEKDFFIYSLIKIYKKYTGGRLPELHGFDPQELEQLLGAGLASGAPQARNNMTSPSWSENGAPHHGSSAFQGGRPPNTQQFDRSRQNGREMRPRPSPERVAQERPSQARPTQERMLPQSSSQERVLKTTDSTDSIPRMPGSFPTSDFVRNLRPEKSHSQLRDINPELQSGVVGPREGSVPPVEQQEQNPSRTRSSSPKTFRNRQESQQKGVQGSGRRSGERSRQLGHYAPLDTVSANSSIGRPSSSDRNQLPTPLRSGMPDSWQSSQAVRRERRPSNTSRRPSSSQKHPETEASQERPTHAIAPEVRVSHSRNSSTLSSRQDRGAEPISIQSAESGEVGAQTNIITNGDDHTETTTVRNATANGEAPADSEMSDSVDGLSKASVQPLPEVSPEAIPEVKPHRPGLGPMIKSKPNQDVANKFRKAATAYNAFIPRAGGAAAKVRGEEDNSDKQNDGISGVYPAPSIGKTINHESSKPPSAEKGPGSEMFASEANISSMVNAPTPSVKSPEKSADETLMQESSPSNQFPSQIPDVSEIPQDDRPRKRRSDHSAKYAKLLGINHSILEGRTFEIETILNEFGWKEELSRPGAFEDIQLRLKKELAQVEAGSWLGALENSDERVMTIGHMMDKVVAECEELDCLLTLYNVELGTLSEDVAYIEAQSQGLQVQTANQKLLYTELKSLLDTISISAADLRILKDASLSKTQGFQQIERTLSQLYTAMLTIDPKLHESGARPSTADEVSTDGGSVNGLIGSELSSMRAVRDKKDGYRKESTEFIQRLAQFMTIKFRETESLILDSLELRRSSGKARNLTRLDFRLREAAKESLWLYSPLMLFTREMQPSEWNSLIRVYERCAKKPYQDEFTDHIFAWKSITRKPLDAEDILFTTQEKESESIVGRKLTVKRAKTVRSDGSSRISASENPQDGKVNAYEAFAGALSEMTRLILVEQNFVVDLFHMTSLENTDFIDAITRAPEARNGGNPTVKKLFDPDRTMAKRVTGTMEEIYSFWPMELQSLADWVVKYESVQGVGVILSLESQLSELEETNQEFLTHTITKVHDRLASSFNRFIDEQIRGIEDTKVKIKKRKGVISFMKTFPHFSMAIENMLPPLRNIETLPIRIVVNEAYQKLNKAMFESLKFIAKETPLAVSQAQSTGDPEDKEALNYHILLIENMNHYVEEVTTKSNPVLEDWRARAQREMAEHMELYISAVVRRPLGKLLDFLESTESLALNAPGGPASIALRASHSKSAMRKLLAANDTRELRRGVDTLKKRVEKHFGDADEAELSRALVVRVIRACEGFYGSIANRISKVIEEVYEGGLEGEWKKEDFSGAFRR